MIQNHYILLVFCFLDIFKSGHCGIRVLEGLKVALQNTNLKYISFNDKTQLKPIPGNQNFKTFYLNKESSHACTLSDSGI